MKVKDLVTQLSLCNPEADVFAYIGEPLEIDSVDDNFHEQHRVDLNVTVGAPLIPSAEVTS